MNVISCDCFDRINENLKKAKDAKLSLLAMVDDSETLRVKPSCYFKIFRKDRKGNFKQDFQGATIRYCPFCGKEIRLEEK